MNQDQTAIRRPYSTTNRALAVALATLGVPPHEADGKQIPCLNSYTPSILRGIERKRAGMRQPPLGLAGKSLEDAILLAYRAGEPGKVEYQFQVTPLLHEIVEGWAEQSALIEAAERGDGSARTQTGNLPISPTMAARVMCQYFKMGQEIEGRGKNPPLWKALWPLANHGEISSHGNALPAAPPPGQRIEPKSGLESTGSFHLKSVKV